MLDIVQDIGLKMSSSLSYFPIFKRSKLSDVELQLCGKVKRQGTATTGGFHGRVKPRRRRWRNRYRNSTRQNENSKGGGSLLKQMYLDLGQKKFGHITCSICGMVYTQAESDDEDSHRLFHERFLSGIRFSGWKNEHVLTRFLDGRIIVVLPTDHPSRVKKILEIKAIIDDQLGIPHEDIEPQNWDCKAFLFIANTKTVAGCLIAEEADKARRLLPSKAKTNRRKPSSQSNRTRQVKKYSTDAVCSNLPDWCSDEEFPVICGVSRVWVDARHRRNKIATRMMDCLLNNFLYGHVLEKSEIAFSAPTADGNAFANHYFQSASYLVYHQ